MPKKQMIEFVETKRPITEPVTKFGGQPVWIDKPQWPVSKQSGKPMQFICQVRIDPALFGDCPAQMAYFFMTDDTDDPGMYETWEPDGGENAVILQPGNTCIKTKPLTEGPCLYRMLSKLFKKTRVEQPCEYSVNLQEGNDPEFLPEPEKIKLERAEYDSYCQTIEGNKIGGTPYFIQNDEIPYSEGWKLLLQLDVTSVPFWINFGDSGVGHVFLNKQGTEAKFGWQCC